MKISNILKFAVLSAALMVGACTTKQEVAATPPPPAPPPPMQSAPQPPGIVPGSVQDFKVNVGDTVHFAYNEYNIQDTDKNTLQKQATWLNKYPGVQLTIEGDCDERGTEEYNRSLGERRALALREQLISLGINPSIIDTVSYGKDRPADPGHDESAWKQNRRGEFLLETPPK